MMPPWGHVPSPRPGLEPFGRSAFAQSSPNCERGSWIKPHTELLRLNCKNTSRLCLCLLSPPGTCGSSIQHPSRIFPSSQPSTVHHRHNAIQFFNNLLILTSSSTTYSSPDIALGHIKHTDRPCPGKQQRPQPFPLEFAIPSIFETSGLYCSITAIKARETRSSQDSPPGESRSLQQLDQLYQPDLEDWLRAASCTSIIAIDTITIRCPRLA